MFEKCLNLDLATVQNAMTDLQSDLLVVINDL
jgi:hypothetical protein